jgi:uncharacterized protein (TIGR03437 family)
VRLLAVSLCALSCFGADFKPRVLAFEARGGQYVSHGAGYSLSLTAGAAVLDAGGHKVRMSVADANPAARLEGLDRMPGNANYLLGSHLRASYELYGAVRRRGVYDGIDLLFRGNDEHLEYDFELAAGRDPGRIRLVFDGADEIRIDPDGALILRAGAFEIRQPRPVAWQVVAGRKKPVNVAYRLDSSHQVRFRTGNYDRTQPLTIDPQIVFNNSFGGTGTSNADAIALDTQGNIYVAGETNATDFPVQSAAQNHAGAAPLLASADSGQTWTAPRLGAAGSVRSIASSPPAPSTLYAAASTGFIRSADGGITWSAPANTGLPALPTALAVDAGSSLKVYAGTANQGVFTSADGGANWSGSTNGLIIAGTSPPTPPQISVLAASPVEPGTVFAVAPFSNLVYRSTDSGQTWTRLTLPGTSVLAEALVFSPADPGTLFLGQQSGALLTSNDGGITWTGLANQDVRNPQGLAIFPGSPSIVLAASQENLARSADGGSTFTNVLALRAGSIAVDPRNAGIAYALDSSGLYRSTDSGLTWTKTALPYQVLPAALFVSAADSRVLVGQGSQTDAFVIKWSPDGSRIVYATYLGGSGNESAIAIAVDSAGSAYVTGTTNSQDFPVSRNAFQKTLGGTAGQQNVFISKLSADGAQLIYSTLLGSGTEVAPRIAVDRAGEALVAGGINGAVFPVTAGAFQSAPVAGCPIQSPFVQTFGTGFVSKIAADGGSLVFSTLLGGSCGTRVQAAGFDATGNAWVAGWTDSPNFPVTPDAWQHEIGGDVYDGFLARFNAGGALAYASYVGGTRYDTVTGLAFDQKGNIYLTGTSGGLLQPASPGAFQPQVTIACVIASIGPSVYQATGSAFVLKLDPAAHTTLGLTYMGSPLCLFPSAIAVDAAGEPWIAGPLSIYGSTPQTASPFQIGIGNGFVSKFSADFTKLQFSTYFDAVNGIALDPAGAAYVAGAGAGTSGKAYVAKIDPAPPVISLDSVQNAINPASPSNVQGITPGELLRIVGKAMGPSKATPGVISGGVLANTVAGVQVTFDGVPMPLLSVSAGEILLMAPFGLAAKAETTVQVLYQGVASNAVRVAMATGIRFFGVPSGIPFQVLGVFNADFTFNSAKNPAAAGSTMMLYVSGAGQTVPPSRDGQVNGFPLAAAPSPVLIAVSNGNFSHPVTLPVTFAGAAPGLAAGIFQINFVAPQQSATGLNLTVGQASGPFDVFVQ